MKISLLVLFSVFVMNACGVSPKVEPLRFERILKAEKLTMQAHQDGQLIHENDTREYRFKIKHVDRVSLVLEVLSSRPDLDVRLVRRGILWDRQYVCKNPITDQSPCKIEIPEPETGDYSVRFAQGRVQVPSVQYRIFAAVHGPGTAAIVWEEDIANR